MAKTQRGGNRPGAGRKPVLSWEERLLLGAEAEEKLRKAAAVQLDAMIATRNQRFDLQEKWARLRTVPVRQRRTRLSNSDDPVAETVLDVRDAIAALYGSTKINVSPAKLRYGQRREILAALAEEASDRLARPISGRMVERCLEEVRNLNARLRKDDV